MHRAIFTALAAAAAAYAHYTLPALIVGGQSSGDWIAVRRTVNWQDNGFVDDVTSPKIRCNELNPGKGAPVTANVTAGAKVAFSVAPSLTHPGPLSFYMAKVPEGFTAATWDGTGEHWFKIFHERPSFGSGITWPTGGLSKAEVAIPACIPSGEYLLRVEHVALQLAMRAGGAQFYHSCAQIAVSGGGTTNPGPKVAFPGAYTAQDPGLLINIYYPIPTSYKNPGPPVFSC